MRKIFQILFLVITVQVAVSQTKSELIQTIDGKKFYIHKMEKGQSLYSLTKLYNVKLDDIYTENPELKDGAKAGQEIKIPYANPVASKPDFNDLNKSSNTTPVTITDTSKYITHKVQKGETVYAITKKYNLSADYFDQMNPNAKGGLREGQLLVIGSKYPRKSEAVKIETLAPQPFVVSQDSMGNKTVYYDKKEQYKIALILPFKLDEVNDISPSVLVKNNSSFPPISSLAIDFYLGFKWMADSLETSDFNLNIDLHDLDDKDSLNMVNLTNSLDTKPYDFIFGPVYASGFKTISLIAKEKNIPIVSPLTQQNKFLYNNQFASKTNPSQYTMLESLAKYLVDSVKPQKAKVLLNLSSDKDTKEGNFVKAFRQYYNDFLKKSGYPAWDTLVTIKGMEGVKKNYSDAQKCVVVSLTYNQVLITDFITQLAVYANKKDITLCGWQFTTGIDNLDQNYLNQLNYIFPNPNKLSEIGSYGSICHKYKELVGAFPDEYFFMGADIASYYLSNLKEFGKEFIFRLNELPADLNYLRFNFKRPDTSTGFDNTGVFIYQYNNYQLRLTGWK